METYRYEVWALGFNKDGWCTDIEELIGEFESSEKAIECAKCIWASACSLNMA